MASPADASNFMSNAFANFARGRELRLREKEFALRQRLADAGLAEQEIERQRQEDQTRRGAEFNQLASQYLGQPRRNLLAEAARGPLPGFAPGIDQIGGSTSADARFQQVPSFQTDERPTNAQSQSTARSPVGASLNWGNFNRDEMMQAMIAADPQRAMEIRKWGDERWKQEAAHDYRLAEQIYNAPDAKSAFESLAPEIIDELAGDGIQWQGLNSDQARNIARHLMSELSPLAGIDAPKWSSPQEALIDGQERFVQFDPYGNTRSVQGAVPRSRHPGSYDEFALAQQDPEFKAFLKERGGKGISITQPDGSVIQIGGDGGAIGPGDLTAPTRNKLQESLVHASDELDRLNSIGQSFDPKFLTIKGRALGAGLKLKDIGGGLFGQMTPDEQNYLRRYSAFRAESGKNLSAILNRLSGAAISPAEAERLKRGIPNEEDGPTEFQAKYTSAIRDVTRATMRANWALKNGIGVRSVDQLSQVMPLDAIDQVYEQRANQIWQQLGGTPETKQQAIRQANQEFGLAR